MKLSGWIFMIIAWSGIITLAVFSFSKLIIAQEKKKKKGNKPNE